MEIKINNQKIGDSSPVFIIAEIGINHNGDVNLAKKMIKRAKECGVNAVKFQTFKAEHITTKKSELFNVFKNAELSEKDFQELSNYSKKNSIMFFSTAASLESIEWLTKIRIPIFKISSGNLTNHQLLSHVAKKKKPMIISTGMANTKEVLDAVKTIEKTGNKKIVILHSVSTYPTPPSEVNLNVIEKLQEKFDYPIGYSDNGKDELVPLIAVAKGAKVIERHFTLNRKMNGHDHAMSTEPDDFKKMVQNIRLIEKMLGEGIKKCQPSEIPNKSIFRRSIIADRDIEKGEKISEEMLRIKRPDTGIQPKYLFKVIGKITNKRIKKETPMQWKFLKK
jgi:N,N'-diacetyllegionaminate synthase